MCCPWANSSFHPRKRDEMWLKRAYCFADFGINNSNNLKNVPDNPNSLFEGIAGFGLFLATFSDPSLHDTLKCFPL